MVLLHWKQPILCNKQIMDYTEDSTLYIKSRITSQLQNMTYVQVPHMQLHLQNEPPKLCTRIAKSRQVNALKQC